jgi:protoporphyrinogen/coproporphyrinogen III oxidase
MKSVAIIGAGITGLTTAHYLRKFGFNGKIKIFYEGNLGGSIKSIKHNDCLLELGPETWQAKTPLLWDLADQLNIRDQIIMANQASNKRFVLREGFLSPVPMKPFDFIFGSLLFINEKYKIFKAMRRPVDVWERQTLFDLASQVGGYDFAEALGSAFSFGIFGCEGRQVEFSSAFPALYEKFKTKIALKQNLRSFKEIPADWSKDYSDYANQSFKRGLFSFKNGLQTLTDTMVSQHDDKNILSIKLSVRSIKAIQSQLSVQAGSGSPEKFDKIVFTGTISGALKVFKSFGVDDLPEPPDLSPTPITVVHTAWKKKELDMNAFGFLVSKKEKQSLLGALFSSKIFDDRVDNSLFLTKIMVPGNSELFSDQEVAKRSTDNLTRILKTKASPLWSRVERVKGGIPRYLPGFGSFRRALVEKLAPHNIVPTGWHYGPIGLPDSASMGKKTAKELLS